MDSVEGKKRAASSTGNTPAQTPTKITKKTRVYSSAAKRVKLESDRRRQKTRVNIGAAFEKWKILKESLGMTRDPQLALFLLESFEKNTASEAPVASTPHRPSQAVFGGTHPPSSVTAGESDRDDFQVAGVQPLKEDKEIELLEASIKSIELEDDAFDEKQANSFENSVIELDLEGALDPYDSDYVPPISLRGASQDVIDQLPCIGLDEAVFDIAECVEEEFENDPEELSDSSIPIFPKHDSVLVQRDLINQQACIAYCKSLLQMANFLQLPLSKCHYSDRNTGADCDARPPFHVKSRPRGTALILEWFCQRGHKLWSWNSQPILKHGMQGGDFMLSTNILLSGNNFSKIALLFRFMNMGMVASPTFFSIQGTYCIKSIREYWEEKRNAVIQKLQSKYHVVALADGRMDSPGHSAMCCTYTTMDLDTMDIISVVNVDKRCVGRKSSAMEKAAFIETFDNLTKELNIKEIVTDAHVQIAALMHPERGRYRDHSFTHSLDVWHASKNLTKKLHGAGMVSGQKPILGWIRDIINHFWYACQHTSTRDEFMNVWSGVLHHVSGEHEWAFGRCFHGPLGERPGKELILSGSAAHVALSQIVLNERWLKNIEKLLTFRITSTLESFQNHILMYAGKRFAFSFGVYEARTLFAALDYNHHNHRPVQVNSKGKVKHKRVYSKNSQRYTVHTVKENKDYGYIPELQTRILQKRLSSAGGLPKRRRIQADDPRALGPLSGIIPPPTAELVQTQQRRGQDWICDP